MLGHRSNANNNHQGCLDMDWIPIMILDDDYCNLIHVQASLIMLIGILSTFKHPWWWLLGFHYVQASLMIIGIWFMSKPPWWCWLGFYQCPSILNDNYGYLICAQASLMMITAIKSMSKYPWWCWLGFYQCPSILDDNNGGLIYVQASLMMIIGILSLFRNQLLVIITKIWSWWQLELVAWPIFGKDYQNLVAMTIGIGHVTNFW